MQKDYCDSLIAYCLNYVLELYFLRFHIKSSDLIITNI